MTDKEAKALFKLIREIRDNLSELILSAWEQKAWLAAGYATWEACCAAEFPDLILTQRQRLHVVGELAGSGMSDRAIAVALNMSHPTVAKVLSSRGKDLPPEYGAVTGRDGKRYARDYVPADDAREQINDLFVDGLQVKKIAELSGVPHQTTQKVKLGIQKTIGKDFAEAIRVLHASTRSKTIPVQKKPDQIADVVPIQRKTGPQLTAARAEARHSLVNAAITMQKAARQIGLVQAEYLEFGRNDQELDQAPEIISDAISSIRKSMKGIRK